VLAEASFIRRPEIDTLASCQRPEFFYPGLFVGVGVGNQPPRLSQTKADLPEEPLAAARPKGYIPAPHIRRQGLSIP